MPGFEDPLPKRNAVNDVGQMWRPVVWCALFLVAPNLSLTPVQSGQTDKAIVDGRIAFLSGPADDRPQPAEPTPPAAPPPETDTFDGVWIFTSAGCRYTGTLPARIVGGKIIVRGGSGQVDPDGTLHSVGAGNGMTLTAVGQLSGDTGSGTFNRSDGCVGSWIAIRRATPRRHR
jgi:hypothetical protein